MDINALMKEHRVRVRNIAFSLVCRLPPNEQLDDLVQEGMMALFQALQRYKEEAGTSFWTYAHSRVHGAMLDYLRSKGPISRLQYKRRVSFARAKTKLQQDLMREPTDGELAQALGFSPEEFTESQRLTQISFQSLEFANTEDDGFGQESESLLDFLQLEDTGNDPETLYIERQRVLAVIKRLKGLSARNQEVARLLMEEDLNLKEIGERLGITESRVCQLRQYILDELKWCLENY